MNTLTHLMVGTLAVAAVAQSPCNAPRSLDMPRGLVTPNYGAAPGQNDSANPPVAQDLPAGYRGTLTVADFTAEIDLLVDRIDFRLEDDGLINWSDNIGMGDGPGLRGYTAAVNVYKSPDTWSNASLVDPPSPATGWTQVASGTLTVGLNGGPSITLFAQPFTIPAGTNGFAFELEPVRERAPHITYADPPYALHPNLMVDRFAPGLPVSASNQFLRIDNPEWTREAFVALTGPALKSMVYTVHYRIPGNAAWSSQLGAGCYSRPRAFYELFEGDFDLSRSTIGLELVGDGYRVSAGGAGIVAPSSPPLADAGGGSLGDDDRTGVLDLGFSFPFPGGSTSQVIATTNGCVFMDLANSGLQRTVFDEFGLYGFLAGQPMHAPLWFDFDPTLGGAMHFEADLAAPVPMARITWLDMAEWRTPGSSNTLQCAFYADGRVEYRYGDFAIRRALGLLGFSPGRTDIDPGEYDVSARMPFEAGDGTRAPGLSLDARPILGSTIGLDVRDVPAGAPGFVLLGLPGPVRDLWRVGMPGCVQQIVPFDAMALPAHGGVVVIPLALPADASLVDVRVAAQCVLESPQNVAGLIVSGGVCLRLGSL